MGLSKVTFGIGVSVLFAMTSVSAQESVNYASIGGRVSDASGAVVEGAKVIARQTETNLTASEKTDRGRPLSVPLSQGGPI